MFAFKTAPPPDLGATVIGTERLSLEPIREEHAPDIFREFTSEVAVYMCPKPAAHPDETLRFIRESLERMAAGSNLQLVIRTKADSTFLGCCGLHPGDGPLELGIWLKKAAHGQGYGKEAIGGLLAWAGKHLRAESVLYPVDRRNLPSRRIPEGLGGVLVGTREHTGAAGNALHLLVYQLTPPGTALG